jgi:hypothetical protein
LREEEHVADPSAGSRETPVVTPTSLPPLRQVEFAVPAAERGGQAIDPVVRQMIRTRYRQNLDKIHAKTEASSPNVLVTVQDREASLLQSRIAEEADRGRALEAGGREAMFAEGAFGGDLLGWLRGLFDHVDQSHMHAIVPPPDALPEALPDRARIAMVGDWGTNLYGAPVSAASIKQKGGYHLLLHLGDIYYSGTRTEVRTRFLDVWPKEAGATTRMLNGNHEMYSGGFAYFDDMLPAFGQRSSYFALQNAGWLLVGLDSACLDHDLDATQVAWLQTVIRNAGARKVVLFSHHQPFSRLDKQGPKLSAALSGLLTGKAITAWYWGHEHECVIYDRHPAFGLFGRCLGHGGIPSPRKDAVTGAPSERTLAGIAWKRLSATADSPSCLALDGPNPLIRNEEKKFGPHGYVTLELDGPTLIERVHLPDGTEIFKNEIR